jgi:hypothetical protein
MVRVCVRISLLGRSVLAVSYSFFFVVLHYTHSHLEFFSNRFSITLTVDESLDKYHYYRRTSRDGL